MNRRRFFLPLILMACTASEKVDSAEDPSDSDVESDTHTDTDTDTDADTDTDTDTADSDTEQPWDDPETGGTPVACKTWDFDGDTADWTLLNGMSLSSGQEGGSTTFSTGSDPHMSASASVDMDECTLIEVVMQVSGAESYWEAFWQRDTDSGFSGDRRMRFELFADETWVRYVFDLSSHQDWGGQLSQLRLDPHEGNGTVKIKRVRLLDPQGTYPPPLDMSEVTWLHTDVTQWPQTATLSSVSIDSSQICMNYDKANDWPVGQISDVDVVGNPWVFIWRPDLEGDDGRWYGATWEWLRPGQTCKASASVAGDHIKQNPYHATSGWSPSSGETLYFMVSGMARLGTPNIQERSNTYQVVWP